MAGRRSRAVALALAATGLLLAPGAAGAATFTVSSTGDAGAGTLRAAVLAAAAASGDDTIALDPSLSGQTITLLTPLPFAATTGTTTIDGGSTAIPVTVSGGGTAALLDVGTGATVRISRVTLADAVGADGADGADGNSIPDGTNSFIGGDGGSGGRAAITVHPGGALTIESSTVTNLHGGDGGDGGRLGGGAGGGAGALHSGGTLTILASTLIANSGGDGGTGGAGSTGTAPDQGGCAAGGGGAGGGAIVNVAPTATGQLTVRNSTLSANRGGAGGPGGSSVRGAGGGGGAAGAAIIAAGGSSTVLEHVTVSGSVAVPGGDGGDRLGGLLSCQNSGGGGGGTGGGGGGGIPLNDRGTPGNGGAGPATTGSPLELANRGGAGGASTPAIVTAQAGVGAGGGGAGNASRTGRDGGPAGGGGGGSNGHGGSPIGGSEGRGGGGAGAGGANVEFSTTGAGGGGGFGGGGGGQGAAFSTTVAPGLAPFGGNGGGFGNGGIGRILPTAGTLGGGGGGAPADPDPAGDQPGGAGGLGSGALVAAGTVTVTASILANTASGASAPLSECRGTITGGANLLEDAVGCTRDLADGLVADPLLVGTSPVAAGGPTATLAPAVGSPAIGAGPATSALTLDQRGPGFPRRIGPATDIGAVEASVPLTLRTVLDPPGDPGRFDVLTYGTAVLTGAGDGATATTPVEPGTQVPVGVAAGPGTSLADYASVIDCGAGPVAGPQLTASFSLAGTCTVTSTRRAAAPAPPTPPATPVAPAPAPTVADELLACTPRPLVVYDVRPVGRNRARVSGAARTPFVGRRVVLRRDGRVVGRALVGADGLFSATVPAPTSAKARRRATYDARTTATAPASSGTVPLLLLRRIPTLSVARGADTVTVAGRVSAPFRASVPVSVITRTGCVKNRTLATGRLSSSGRFSIRVPRAALADVRVVRVVLKVPSRPGRRATNVTYSLPAPVG
ncbi:hypothetical protein GKE82_17055 [Conexibacter sp. W3-3-2]|uniref:choice-of-anchor Q domain-containing protein n=1 Tax=Conexibacter sp. W3-3-2 TaxID=2675227 RepID=UPI0012B9CB47|nr:choice-of-anchor Q domain-containing protein [Conexibacter sp. W3-3-2]MTD45949.1 hypothetical protein [Conexibacter sp. W3-3-2]